MHRFPLYAFFTANAISLIGNNLTLIAVPWFVLETTGSAAKTGLVGFFTALPAIIAAFFGGTIVDRFGHKQIFWMLPPLRLLCQYMQDKCLVKQFN